MVQTPENDPRDPRLDPQAGDIIIARVWSPPRRRIVTRRVGGNVYYQLESGAEKCSWISTWMEWCRAKKVEVQNAPPI
jgi:hypothetical protein